jgi:hypothetical protein
VFKNNSGSSYSLAGKTQGLGGSEELPARWWGARRNARPRLERTASQRRQGGEPAPELPVVMMLL